MLAALDGARCSVQIDVEYGDAVTPAAECVQFTALMEDVATPSLRAYPIYAVIAEKYEAIVSLSMVNTRLKDYFDLWFLATYAQVDEAFGGRSRPPLFVAGSKCRRRNHSGCQMLYGDQTAAMASLPFEKQAHGAGPGGSGSGTAPSFGIVRQWSDRLELAVSAGGTDSLHGPLLDFALDPSHRLALDFDRSWESAPLDCIIELAARLPADCHHLLQPDEPNVGAGAWRATFDSDVNRLLIHVRLKCQCEPLRCGRIGKIDFVPPYAKDA